MTKLAIIGAGGHGRVVADCAHVTGLYEEIIFLDDCFPERTSNARWQIIDTPDNWPSYAKDYAFIVAFGNNELRRQYVEQLSQNKQRLISLVHPTAVIASGVDIGAGSVVFANATINIGTSIGRGCILNTACSVDHDCTIQDFVHISPQAAIAGGVQIQQDSWIGINTTIKECLTLAKHTQTGAGSVIINNTESHTLYVGVPATAKKKLIS